VFAAVVGVGDEDGLLVAAADFGATMLRRTGDQGLPSALAEMGATLAGRHYAVNLLFGEEHVQPQARLALGVLDADALAGAMRSRSVNPIERADGSVERIDQFPPLKKLV
jgi:hypothetical protein